MGYFERYCQLCGVSFAIGRIRRPDEGPEASYDFSGGTYVDMEPCDEGTGCESWDDEHIAGPDCECEDGYSGYRISLEEMNGCRAVQCLAMKRPSWEPEPDDEPFELESNYFLTGVGNGSPDAEPLRDLEPARHKVDRICVANTLWDGTDPTQQISDDDLGIPFHPTCFKIFKMVSELRLGRIDVEGLFSWRKHVLDDSVAGFKRFHHRPRHPAVEKGREQWWRHEPGSEFLVANPVEIPDLQMLFDRLRDDHLRVRKGHHHAGVSQAFPQHVDGSSADNFFTKLPVEVNFAILEYCSLKDIASLQLVSRVFWSPPASLYQKFFLKDMPWFWEAWDVPTTGELPWEQLYKMVKTSWLEIKGLKNRKRIWEDIERLLEEFTEYRKKGVMPE